MKLRDIFRFSYNALKSRKLRAALTIVGIAVGPAAIVALVASTQGFAAQATTQFDKLGSQTILVQPVGRFFVLEHGAVGEAQRASGGAAAVVLDSAKQNTLAGLDGVKEVLPYYSARGSMRTGSQNAEVSIIATDTGRLRSLFPGIQISDGSFPGSGDLTSAVIGYNVAHPGGGASDLSVGQVISVSYQLRQQGRAFTQTRSFLVDGILDKFGQGLFLNPDNTIFVGIGAGKLLTNSNSYSGFYMVAKTQDDVNNVVQQISDRYGTQMRAITVSSILSTVQSVSANIGNLLGSVAAVSVVVAFTGIMTTMLTSVNERTKEIGLLKALGTPRRGIMTIFLSEAILAGFIGGLVGAVLGSSLSFWVASSLFGGGGLRLGGPIGIGGPRPPGQVGGAASTVSITPLVSPQLFGEAILLSILVAILAGLIPAWKASKLTPVQALRKE